jgi:hypothetical protein
MLPGKVLEFSLQPNKNCVTELAGSPRNLFSWQRLTKHHSQGLSYELSERTTQRERERERERGFVVSRRFWGVRGNDKGKGKFVGSRRRRKGQLKDQQKEQTRVGPTKKEIERTSKKG